MITYRNMELDDWSQLHALWLDTPGMGLNATDDSRQGLARFLARNPTSCFVALDSGRVVGAILAGHDGRRGYIYHTAVRTELRGRGIGRALVERALAALRAEGIAKVALVAFARNTAGNAFWQRLGFEPRADLVYRNRALVELERLDT